MEVLVALNELRLQCSFYRKLLWSLQVVFCIDMQCELTHRCTPF